MSGLFLHTVHLTLEAISPLAIGSGEKELIHRKRSKRSDKTAQGKEVLEDVEVSGIIRDANNLPTIPGSSWQGVVRRLLAEARGEQAMKAILGNEDGGHHANGQAGLVTCGWGLVHDKHDQAVSPLPGDVALNDPILGFLGGTFALLRDHVALNHLGSTEGHRKFQIMAVPKGTRFSIGLSMTGNEEAVAALTEVARMFRHPRFGLGGGTRRGYGRLALIRASVGSASLSDPASIRELRRKKASDLLATDLLQSATFAVPEDTATHAKLNLTFHDAVRFGVPLDHAARAAAVTSLLEGTGGVREVADGKGFLQDRADARAEEKNALLMLQEPWISYTAVDGNHTGRLCLVERVTGLAPELKSELRFPVKATSIKGPIVHRMVFKDNRKNGRTINVDEWLDLPSEEQAGKLAAYATRSDDLARFLGSPKQKLGSEGPAPEGSAARFLFDDSEVEAEWIMAIDHVAIDRLSGSARDQSGMLFHEEVLYNAKLSLALSILPPRGRTDSGPDCWGADVRDAFLGALKDLCTGRLPLGARSLGACSGSISWHGGKAEEWQNVAVSKGLASAVRLEENT